MEQVPTGMHMKQSYDEKHCQTQGPAGKGHKCGARCISFNGPSSDEDKFLEKFGKGNHTTNGCWIIQKQLGFPLSEAAKTCFQKQSGNPKKNVRHRMRKKSI